MIVLPVVSREMGALAARRSTYVIRAGTAAIAMLLMGWLFLIAIAGMSVAQIGKTLFVGVSSLAFVYALLVGIHATSDAISEEKREGTLGLLFLTDLKHYDITLGKLAATSLNAFYALLGLIPTLSLAILLGGVQLSDVGRVSIVLANTMFLSLSVGLLVSAMSVNERRAIFASVILLAVTTIGPFLMTLLFTEFESTPDAGIFLSPLYPFLLVLIPAGSMPGIDGSLFHVSLICQHVAAWLCLVRATLLLPGFVVGVPQTWRDRMAESFNRYVYGSAEERVEYRRRSLDRNAFSWLAAREKNKPVWAWILVGIFFAIYFWVALGFRRILFDLHTSVVLLFLVHVVLKLWIASEVCTRFIQDRRSGALELLLSSPLSVAQIAAGQQLALRRIFGGPLIALVLAEILLMAMALKFMPRPTPTERTLTYVAAISTLLLDLWALKWLGMWLSLFGKSIERVLIATAARVLLAPWILFVTASTALSATMVFYGRRPEYGQLLLIWWFFAVVFSVGFGVVARGKFLRHCREAVADQHESPGSFARAILQKKEQTRTRKTFAPAFVRNRPAIAAATLVAIAVIAVVLVRRVYWAEHLASMIKGIRSRNEPTKIVEIGKVYLPPERKNDAFAVLGNAGMINRAMFARSSWNSADIFNLPRSNYLHGLEVKQREEFATMLRGNAAQLAGLKNAVLYTNAYHDPVVRQRSVLAADLYGYAQLALVDLVIAVDAGDASRVETAAERLLKYTTLLRQQPSWFAQYVAGVLVPRAKIAVEAMFFRELASEAALARMQEIVRRMETPDLLRRHLLISRALALDPPMDAQNIRWSRDPMSAARRAFTSAIGTYQQQLTKGLRRFDEALIFASRKDYDRFLWARKLWVLIDNGMGRESALDKLYESEIHDILLRDLRLVAELRLLETAIALELFRLKHRNHPENLEALVPEFLSSVPIDPFSGESLKWSTSSDGPALWSIGPNGEADGAAAGFHNSDLTFRFSRRAKE